MYRQRGISGVRRVGIPGGVPGWVYQGGYREGYTGTPAMLLGERTQTSGAGPVGPAGAGVGGSGCSGERGGGDGSRTTLRARSGTTGALPVLDP